MAAILVRGGAVRHNFERRLPWKFPARLNLILFNYFRREDFQIIFLLKPA